MLMSRCEMEKCFVRLKMTWKELRPLGIGIGVGLDQENPNSPIKATLKHPTVKHKINDELNFQP